jgi:hypothetical protein
MVNISRLAGGFCAVGALFIAAGAGPNAWAQSAADPHNVCLHIRDVDHTEPVGDKVLLFHMRNGQVWRNQLKSPCQGLGSFGYSERLFNDEVCANQQIIHVLRLGTSCVLGDFTLDRPALKGG